MFATSPSDRGRRTGQRLVDANVIQREVLSEAFQSSRRGKFTEAGRTVCGANGAQVRPPIRRFKRSIMLSRCEGPETGYMHTHITKQQLRNPEHSLMDMAIVLLDEGAASMVVGVEQSDVLYEPVEAGTAEAAFEDAIGVEVRTPYDVLAALNSGVIANPPAARAQVRDNLSGLFQQVPTPHPDFAADLSSLSIPAAAPIRDDDHVVARTDTNAVDTLRDRARLSSEFINSLNERIDIDDALFSAISTNIVDLLIKAIKR